jgi:hypothetical protein
LRNGSRAVIIIFTKEGVEEILNLQPKGSKAKPYQVRIRHPDLLPTTIILDGLESTLYACPMDRLLWIHEVGGIAAVDHWLGPVPAEAGEIEELAPLIQKSEEGPP